MDKILHIYRVSVVILIILKYINRNLMLQFFPKFKIPFKESSNMVRRTNLCALHSGEDSPDSHNTHF